MNGVRLTYVFSNLACNGMYYDEAFRQIQPTELDLALERDPAAAAAHRQLLAASREEAQSPASDVKAVQERQPDEDPPEQANREGQRESAAASLAGGMIAAEGWPVTAAEAVEKVQEVLEELKRRK